MRKVKRLSKDENKRGRIFYMATIKEIAKACNVSIATVSNILNGKPGASEATRSLVLKTVEKWIIHQIMWQKI